MGEPETTPLPTVGPSGHWLNRTVLGAGVTSALGDLVSSIAVGVLWTLVSTVLAFGLAAGVMFAGTLALAGQRDESGAG